MIRRRKVKVSAGCQGHKPLNFKSNFQFLIADFQSALLSFECFWVFLVFRKKDLYLVITQKLIFMKFSGFREIRQISCEINRHSLPTALHKTEEFLLSYLIYKVFRWISWNPPDFERPIARNGNAYVFYFILCHFWGVFSRWKHDGKKNRGPSRNHCQLFKRKV